MDLDDYRCDTCGSCNEGCLCDWYDNMLNDEFDDMLDTESPEEIDVEELYYYISK